MFLCDPFFHCFCELCLFFITACDVWLFQFIFVQLCMKARCTVILLFSCSTSVRRCVNVCMWRYIDRFFPWVVKMKKKKSLLWNISVIKSFCNEKKIYIYKHEFIKSCIALYFFFSYSKLVSFFLFSPHNWWLLVAGFKAVTNSHLTRRTDADSETGDIAEA